MGGVSCGKWEAASPNMKGAMFNPLWRVCVCVNTDA